MPSGVPKGQTAKRSKTRQSQDLRLSVRRYFVHLVLVEGYKYAAAFRRVFPAWAKRITPRQCSYTGKGIFESYMEEHEDDAKEMAKVYDLGITRYFKELDQRLQANTLRDVIKTKMVTETRHDKKGRPYKKKVPVVVRNTEEVIDNTTRMNATAELGKSVGVHKQDFTAQGVIIFKPGLVQKPHGAGRSQNVPKDEDE